VDARHKAGHDSGKVGASQVESTSEGAMDLAQSILRAGLTERLKRLSAFAWLG
jgi:predicted heme/steroid binding protein